jgi:4-amino-4-deoxychorismate lyase
VIIHVNGKLQTDQEAVVSIYDHGFLYGMGVFETFRTYQGRPFLLDWHLQRLHEGCRELGIAFRARADEVTAWADEILKANGLADGYFRLTVTAGTGLLGLPDGAYPNPTVLLYVKPLPASSDSGELRGKPVQLLKLARNSPEGRVRLKSLHYMNNILAKRELASYPWAGGAEGLFLDSRGYVAEGIVSNLFFVREGVVYTPSLDTGILPGVTRRWVAETVHRLGGRLVEGLFTWDQLLLAEEAFLTNSIQEILPVSRFFDGDGNCFLPNGGLPGEWTRRLQRLYQRETSNIGSEPEPKSGKYPDTI